MNRLIIIGNGFDLSHGLKTSYKDFIEYQLKDIYQQFHSNTQNETFDHPLIKLTKKRFGLELPEPSDDFCAIDFLIKRSDIEEFCKVEFKGFFKDLFSGFKELDWVDIELWYFNTLCKIIGDRQELDSKSIEKIQELNSDLDHITELLSIYLKSQKVNSKKSHNKYHEIFNEPLNKEDIGWKITNPEGIEQIFDNENAYFGIEKTLFLNFNYTDTLTAYINYMLSQRKRYYKNLEECDDLFLYHIHGSLVDKTNPPIFGFGDEFNKKYQLFEDINCEFIFDHIKSYRYLLTDNYKKLQSFLNQDYYQVFVVGHSCGLTDRTLLKSIFENKNCCSIKLFHQNDDNNGKIKYKQKAIQVGRHISDKQYMRNVISVYNPQNCLP